MKYFLKATTPIILATSLCIPLKSHAYLGGFEDFDGYYVPPVLPTMVNSYNAGEYGTTNGGLGGAYTPYVGSPPYDQGLWNDKNDAYSTYNIGFSGGIPYGYYVTAHNPVPSLGMFPHSGNAMLALRNTLYASVGPVPEQPLDFRYSLDTRDFYNGGSPVNPVDTGDKIVDWSIWAAPGPVTNPNDGIWLSFLDNAGNIGFQFGWNETYQLRYRDTASNPWINTGYVFGQPWIFPPGVQPVIYDRFDFSLDLLNDTWSLDVFSGVSMNTISGLVLDRAFGQNLLNFTTIDWHVSYGNEKSFFDDSGFIVRPAQVPEPGTFALVALGSLLLWQSRRRNSNRE